MAKYLEGLKYCPGCDDYFDPTPINFSNNRNTPDKLNLYCKECLRLRSIRKKSRILDDTLIDTSIPIQQLDLLPGMDRGSDLHCYYHNKIFPIIRSPQIIQMIIALWEMINPPCNLEID